MSKSQKWSIFLKFCLQSGLHKNIFNLDKFLSLFKNIHGWFCFLPPSFKYTFWGCGDICDFMERNWYILSFGINLHTRLVNNFLLIMKLFTSSDDRKFPRIVTFLWTAKKRMPGKNIVHIGRCKDMLSPISVIAWSLLLEQNCGKWEKARNQRTTKQIWQTAK